MFHNLHKSQLSTQPAPTIRTRHINTSSPWTKLFRHVAETPPCLNARLFPSILVVCYRWRRDDRSTAFFRVSRHCLRAAGSAHYGRCWRACRTRRAIKIVSRAIRGRHIKHNIKTRRECDTCWMEKWQCFMKLMILLV